MTKIAIQGVHGCFHEQAARLFYGNEIGVCECLSFEDLFVALDQGKASGAIMAIENTVAGGLLPNYSLLHKHSRKVIPSDSAKPDGFARADYRRDY